MSYCINKSKYIEEYTQALNTFFRGDEVFNFQNTVKGFYSPRYMKSTVLATKSVLKKMLGKQQIVISYSYRYWIWTLSDNEEKATLYLMCSKRGLSFECDSRSDSEILKKIYFDFVEDFYSKKYIQNE